MKEWSWIQGGIALAIIGVIAAVLVSPMGASTQFVIADAIVADAINDNVAVQKLDENGNPVLDAKGKPVYESSNAYLNKSHGKYAKNVENPVNYGFIFVLSILLGAFLSAKFGGPRPTEETAQAPEIWRARFGNSVKKRYLHAFIGGFLVLVGARLAGGCTSGHMISGIAQLSISGFIFTMAMFGAAVVSALLLYRNVKA